MTALQNAANRAAEMSTLSGQPYVVVAADQVPEGATAETGSTYPGYAIVLRGDAAAAGTSIVADPSRAHNFLRVDNPWLWGGAAALGLVGYGFYRVLR